MDDSPDGLSEAINISSRRWVSQELNPSYALQQQIDHGTKARLDVICALR
jgi:hypothetical protein